MATGNANGTQSYFAALSALKVSSGPAIKITKIKTKVPMISLIKLEEFRIAGLYY
jgi:hypothetical protein